MFGQRENLRAFFRHQNCVFELCGEAAVLSANCPTIGLVDFGFPKAFVEHRLDGQAGAGTNHGLARLQVGKVWNAWLLMETAADSVTLKFANDFVALGFGEAIDRAADVDDSAEWLDGSNANPHGIERGLHESFGMRSDFADQKCFGRITVPAVNDGCEIDVDDVPLAEHVVIRDAVAHHLVDAGANRVRVSVVAKARGGVPVLDGVFVGQLVDLASGNAGPDVRSQEVHDFGVESARGPQSIAIRMSRVDRDLGQRPCLWS